MRENISPPILFRGFISAFSLFFNTSSDNTFVQERAKSIAARVSNAIFHLAILEPGGIQQAFDRPNRLLDLTAKIYVSGHA